MLTVPPSPGWYPDPAGTAAERWWDGRQWSADLRPAPPGHRGATSRVPAGVPSLESAGTQAGGVIPLRALWWALAGLLAGEIVGSLFVGLVGDLTGNAQGAPATLAGELGLWAGMLGACIAVSHRYGCASLRQDLGLGVRWRDLPLGAGVAAAGLVVTALVSGAFAGTSLSGTNTQILTGERGDGIGYALVTLIAALGAPFFEELFFRGLIRTALASRLGSTAAIWVQAGLFGLAHFEAGHGLGNVSVMVAIGAFGVLLGYTARWTSRLGAGMVAHGLFNTFAAVVILAT